MKHLMSTLVDRLKNSEVFAELQSGKSKGNEELQVVADVLDIFEQCLFVWDAREQIIHVIDINFGGSSSPGTTYQVFIFLDWVGDFSIVDMCVLRFRVLQ